MLLFGGPGLAVPFSAGKKEPKSRWTNGPDPFIFLIVYHNGVLHAVGGAHQNPPAVSVYPQVLSGDSAGMEGGAE